MALQYPGISYLKGYDGKISDVLDAWTTGEAAGKAQRFEEQAPDVAVQGLPSLSEYGLTTSPEDLRAMIANPETRDLAWGQIKDAYARRADAMDPLKQLQLKKAQYDVNNLGKVAPTAEMRNFNFAQDNPAFAEFVGINGMQNAPADVKEYAWYRKNEMDAGRQPLEYLDFLRAQKGDGLAITTNADGTVSVTQGGAGGPKLTEGQSKDAFYYIRGAGANDALSANEQSLTSLKDTVANGIPLAGNYFTSDGFKNANRDGKEFLASVLRKDSGGAITPDEWSYYGPMYLPAPGDTKDQLDRKRDARKRAMDALKATAGPGQIVIDEYERGRAPPADAPADIEDLVKKYVP